MTIRFTDGSFHDIEVEGKKFELIRPLQGMPSFQLGYVLPKGKDRTRLMLQAEREYQSQKPIMTAPFAKKGDVSTACGVIRCGDKPYTYLVGGMSVEIIGEAK